MLVVSYVFILALNFSVLCSALYWRFSIGPLPDYHSIIRDENSWHSVGGREQLRLIAESSLHNRSFWKYPETCIKEIHSPVGITCGRNGNLNLGLAEPSGDQSMITLRVQEMPDHWYWFAQMKRDATHHTFYIRIVPVEERQPRLTLENYGFSPRATLLFNSKGEQPVLSTIFGMPLDIDSFTFDDALEHWILSVSNDIICRHSYMRIDSLGYNVVMGSMINSVLYQIDQVPFGNPATNDNKAVHLSSSSYMIGKIYSHDCFPHRSVLATGGRLYFSKDDFRSTVELQISHSLAQHYGNVVTSLAFTSNDLFVVVGGVLLITNLDNSSLSFKKTNLSLDVKILGVSGTRGCLWSRIDFVTWENSFAIAWSRYAVYATNQHEKGWMTHRLSPKFAGNSIKCAKLSLLPSDIVLLITSQNGTSLLFCSHQHGTYKPSLEGCLHRSMPFAVQSADEVEVDFVSSATPSVIVWTPDNIGFSFDEGAISGKFARIEKVSNVVFATDRGEFLVQGGDKRLFFGRGKAQTLVELRKLRSQSSQNVSYMFQFGSKRPLRVAWRETEDGSLSIETEIFPLLNEVYTVLYEQGAGIMCELVYLSSNLYSFKANVRTLKAADESFAINFTVVYPVSVRVELKIKNRFFGRVFMTKPVTSLITHPAYNPPLREQAIQVTLTGACPNVGNCSSGLDVLEVEAMIDYQTITCALPVTKVLYLNSTCPNGVHIRIRNQTGHACGGFRSKKECLLVFAASDMFSPVLDLYSYDNYLQTISDDLKLTEVQGKAGFEIWHKNLLLKNCYLCSQFRETNSSSELFLQTPISACPCQLQMYGANSWIAKISFENVPVARGTTEDLIFEVSVLGKSFCHLRTRFTLRLVAQPLVEYLLWEYLLILVFVALTVFALMISYQKYMKFMQKAKRSQL